MTSFDRYRRKRNRDLTIWTVLHLSRLPTTHVLPVWRMKQYDAGLTPSLAHDLLLCLHAHEVVVIG